MKTIEFTDEEIDVMRRFCFSYSASNLSLDVINKVQKKFEEADK